MNLNGRIQRLENELGTRDPWGGFDVRDLSRWGYFDVADGEIPRHKKEEPPIGLQKLAAFAGLRAVHAVLRQPIRLKRELEGTREADKYRQERGYPIVLTPDRLQGWQ